MLRKSGFPTDFLVCAGFVTSPLALADGNKLRFYVGAGVGQSNIDQNFYQPDGILTTFPKDRLGWKLFLGIRPLSWLGSELEYIDFGDAHLGHMIQEAPGSITPLNELYGADTTATAGALFAVGHLPFKPLGLDPFAKVGYAYVHTSDSYAGNYPNVVTCPTAACMPIGPVSVSEKPARVGFCLWSRDPVPLRPACPAIGIRAGRRKHRPPPLAGISGYNVEALVARLTQGSVVSLAQRGTLERDRLDFHAEIACMNAFHRYGIALTLASTAALASCAATSSHELIGTARPAISPNEVTIIVQAPEKFEEIAEVKASSGTSLRSAEERFDVALEALKGEAASVGANAVLLEEDEDDSTDTKVSGGYHTTTATSDGTPVDLNLHSSALLSSSVHGLAIYVPPVTYVPPVFDDLPE